MADEWRSLAEKRCNATKANVQRSRSASYANGMMARRTLVEICKESVNVRRLSNCCAKREA